MHDVAACTDKGHSVLDRGEACRCCLVVEVEGMQNFRAFIGQGQTAVAQARREDVSTLAVLDVPHASRAAHDKGGLADEGCSDRAFQVQLQHALVHGLGAKQVEFDLCEAIGIRSHPRLKARIAQGSVEGIANAVGTEIDRDEGTLFEVQGQFTAHPSAVDRSMPEPFRSFDVGKGLQVFERPRHKADGAEHQHLETGVGGTDRTT